jgi:benzoyl-CoA reductase/2-hydroxyglutaryl-CoA dehydratase subunit BcrC/BadD/HgdB
MSTSKKKSRVLQTTKKVGALIMDYFSNAWTAKRQGSPIAWVTVFSPVELLYALGMYPIAPEHFGAMCSARGAILEYLELAESKGYSQNICSYSRGCLGYVLKGLNGPMPPPDLLVTFRNSCDVYVKWWQSIQRHLDSNVPLFIGEAPYVLSEEDLQNYVLDFVVQQLQQIVNLAQERFGLKFDEERLVNTVKLSDKASELWLKTLKLRGETPCPLGGRDSASDIFPLVVLQGTNHAIRFYEELLGEVEGKAERGEGVLENERYRLMFDGIWLWHAFDLIKYFEDKGAVFVYEPYSEAWAYRLDPSKPLESIAKKTLEMGLNVDLDLRLKRFERNIQESRVDGAVIFCNRSCKSWAAPQVVTAGILNEKLGIPTMLFEADMADPRQYSEAQVKNRIDAFLEVLEENGVRRD